MSVIKKLVSTSLAIILSMTSVLHASANFQKKVTGSYLGNSSNFESYLDSLSEDEIIKMNEKLIRAKTIEEQIIHLNKDSKVNENRSATKISIPGTFTIYFQLNDYYCSPACVKSVLQYINGYSNSQSAIAYDLDTDPIYGTDFYKVPPYLNQKQNDCQYLLSTLPSQSSMCAKIYSTIYYDEAPCIMDIEDDDNTYWYYYATDGHSLVVNAIYSDYNRIQFADPLGGEDNIPAFYTKYSSTVSHVCLALAF